MYIFIFSVTVHLRLEQLSLLIFLPIYSLIVFYVKCQKELN